MIFSLAFAKYETKWACLLGLWLCKGRHLRIICLFFMIFGFLHAECEKKILVSMVFGFECVEYEESVLVVQ